MIQKVKGHIYEIDEYGVRNYRSRALAIITVGFLYLSITALAWLLTYFEASHADANITNYADAFWTLQMSASTIGFGDHYPVTIGGRAVVALMFYIGVGIVGFISALIAERILGFADTNVKNRELRKQNADILEHNIQLEKKLDKMIAQMERLHGEGLKENN